MMLNLKIPVLPFPKQRPRSGRGRFYTPRETRESEEDIQALLLREMKKQKAVMFKKPIFIHLTFIIEKPRSVRRKTPCVKPDLDNYLKTFMDAANKILWKDDALVCGIACYKFYGDREETVIMVHDDHPNLEYYCENSLGKK